MQGLPGNVQDQLAVRGCGAGADDSGSAACDEKRLHSTMEKKKGVRKRVTPDIQKFVQAGSACDADYREADSHWRQTLAFTTLEAMPNQGAGESDLWLERSIAGRPLQVRRSWRLI